MPIKTLLLISDDADDHHAFTEALAEQAKAVVLIILDSQKALQLIVSKMWRFDKIFLDLTTYGIKVNSFLSKIREDPTLASTPMIILGSEDDFKRIDLKDGLIRFEKNFDFSDLKIFLEKMVE